MFDEGDGLVERIEKILSRGVEINNLDELYENLPLLEYNISKPKSINTSELYNFSRIIQLFYYFIEKPFCKVICPICNKVEILSFKDVMRIKSSYSEEEIFEEYYNGGFCCNKKADS